jgi:hypothetical protein
MYLYVYRSNTDPLTVHTFSLHGPCAKGIFFNVNIQNTKKTLWQKMSLALLNIYLNYSELALEPN